MPIVSSSTSSRVTLTYYFKVSSPAYQALVWSQVIRFTLSLIMNTSEAADKLPLVWRPAHFHLPQKPITNFRGAKGLKPRGRTRIVCRSKWWQARWRGSLAPCCSLLWNGARPPFRWILQANSTRGQSRGQAKICGSEFHKCWWWCLWRGRRSKIQRLDEFGSQSCGIWSVSSKCPRFVCFCTLGCLFARIQCCKSRCLWPETRQWCRFWGFLRLKIKLWGLRKEGWGTHLRKCRESMAPSTRFQTIGTEWS